MNFFSRGNPLHLAVAIGAALVAILCFFVYFGFLDDTTEPPPPPPVETIGEFIESNENLSTLNTAIGIAVDAGALDPNQWLNDPTTSHTMFAPNNDAFNAIDPTALDELLGAPELLADWINYHVVPDSFPSDALAPGLIFQTLHSEMQLITVLDDGSGGLTINNSDGDNPVVGNFTSVDNEASNGVVHMIDAVLTPFAPFEPNPGTLAARIFNRGNLDRYWDLLEASSNGGGFDWIELFNNTDDNNLTVVAPNNSAINSIDDSIVEEWLANPMGDLQNVLWRLVIEGGQTGDLDDNGLSAGELLALVPVDLTTMNNGETVNVTENSAVGGELFVNGAHVIRADINANNGIMHITDSVVMPVPESIWDIVVNRVELDALEGAFQNATNNGGDDFVTALSQDPYTLFAPDSAAIGALGTDLLNDLMADPAGLFSDVLNHHLIDGEGMVTGDWNDTGVNEFTSVFGGDIDVENVSGTWFVNGVEVTVENIIASNGVIHVLRGVLEDVPPFPEDPPPTTTTTEPEPTTTTTEPEPTTTTTEPEPTTTTTEPEPTTTTTIPGGGGPVTGPDLIRSENGFVSVDQDGVPGLQDTRSDTCSYEAEINTFFAFPVWILQPTDDALRVSPFAPTGFEGLEERLIFAAPGQQDMRIRFYDPAALSAVNGNETVNPVWEVFRADDLSPVGTFTDTLLNQIRCERDL